MKYQPPPSPVDLSHYWESAPEYDGFFAKGARSKSIYYSPTDCDLFIKANHLYMFKEPWWKRGHTTQFWSEIVAYRVGIILGVSVPPTFVGVRNDTNSGELICGALIEWFYDSKSPEFVEYHDAGDILEVFTKGFDRRYGAQHNFISNVELLSLIESHEDYWMASNWLLEFIGFFLFDTIIGNTDRHQDNWGLLIENNPLLSKPKFQVKFSAVYDNGTSLGYEIVDEKLSNFQSAVRRKTYIMKGKHHIRDSLSGDRLRHVGFVEFIVKKFPSFGEIIKDFFNVDMKKVEDAILELNEFDVPIPLGQARAELMINLIHDRIKLVNQALNNI